MLDRKDIDKKYKWDLSVIYADEDAFYKDYANAENMISVFGAYEKTMCRSAKDFYNTLSDLVKIEAVIDRLWQYASLNFSVDTSNNAYQALNAKVQNLAVLAGTASWFVTPYILKLEKSTVNKWFKECPELETFRRMIEKTLREKPHTLSDECEKLMSEMQDCLGSHSNIRSIFSNSDLTFGKIKDEEGKSVEITDTNYVSKLMSSDRRVRQSAFRTLYKTYE